MTKESNRKDMGTTTGEQERFAVGQQPTGGEQGRTTVVQPSTEDSFVSDLLHVPRPTREQVVWAIRIAVVVVVAVLGVLLLLYAISRLPLSTTEEHDVTFLDLLKALALPITAGAVVPLLGWLQSKREREAQAAQRERELAVENQRAETDRQIAAQGRQDGMLQAYIDQIGQLLLDKDRPLLKSAAAREVRTDMDGDEVRTLARARTLTVLTSLDGERKRSVLQFLYESHLVIKGHVVVALRGADLREAELCTTNLSEAHLSAADLRNAVLDAADLRGAELRDADLSDAKLTATNLHSAQLGGADLRNAYLHAADLVRANLGEADLTGAYLHAANLHKVDLSGADLGKAILSDANLRNAVLIDADLRKADLRDADLRDADLSGADLRGANPAKAYLSAVNLHRANLSGGDLRDANLTNAIMPNGQNYEEWLETTEGQQWLETYKGTRGGDSTLS